MAKKMLSLLTILLLVLLALTAIIRWQASVTFSKLEAGEHSLRARWETLTALDARLDTYCQAACWRCPLRPDVTGPVDRSVRDRHCWWLCPLFAGLSADRRPGWLAGYGLPGRRLRLEYASESSSLPHHLLSDRPL